MADELARYLEDLRLNESLTVVQTMKSSPAETTELVADPVGRFMVRKTIARDAGIGRAYEQLKNAWDEGVQLAHLPRVYAFFRTEDAVVVLMEHLQGVDLWKRLDLEGCGVEAARRYFPELCEAVRELHERFDPPIIHRDLKPSNVLIMPDGCVKVLDFGISREFRQGAEADTRFLGTREYAPPEQFGFKQTDVRSDVYSLGMMLYHILTGQTPNASLHTEGFADPDVPAALRPVLMRATEFDPDRRYGSVAELQEAFEAALSGNPLPKPATLTVAGGALAEIDPEAQLENSTFIAVIRDVLAFAIVAFGLFMLIGAWSDPGTEVDWAYRAGELLSGFVIFLPMLPIAYWVSSKRLMKRVFPSLARLTRKQEILYGILFAVAMFVCCFVVLLIVTSSQA